MNKQESGLQERTIKVKFYVGYNDTGKAYDVFKTFKALYATDFHNYSEFELELVAKSEVPIRKLGKITVF